MGNRIRKTLFILLILACANVSAQVPDAYKTRYAALEGKSGASLFSALESIAAYGHSSLSYDGLYNAFLQTDADNSGYLLDMYSTCRFTLSDKCGSYSNVCDCFNREHSLPKSWWGGSKNSAYTDLFHLVPTDGKVNNQRGNAPFGECANGGSLGGHALGKLGSSTFSGYTNVGSVFEPDNQYKGDFARGYFAMIVRYGTSIDLTKSNGSTMFSNTNKNINASNHFGLTNYSVALLMKWHRMDTVSAKEVKRNTGIQATQGNRNPFIDCPILAEYLWGNKAGQAVSLSDLQACGCVDNDGGTALEEVIATTADEVSRLAPVSAMSVPEGIFLTCLPQGVHVLLFDAQGMLLTQEKTTSPELTLPVRSGFYLVVLSIGNETRAIKIKR